MHSTPGSLYTRHTPQFTRNINELNYIYSLFLKSGQLSYPSAETLLLYHGDFPAPHSVRTLNLLGGQ